MKSHLLFFGILTGILIACSPEQKTRTHYDFTALPPFWNITALLQNDSMPPDTLWNQLFSTPGYQTLAKMEIPEKWIRGYLAVGIKPSHRQIYKDYVSKGYWDTICCLHMQEAASRKTEIENFVKVLQSGSLTDQALNHLRACWPNGDTLMEIPNISFLFFNRDARGYDPILIDLLFAMDLYEQEELDEMMAHEAHHFYRRKLTTFIDPPEEHPDHLVLNVLDQIHLEGVADQIDKPTLFANPLQAKRSEAFQKHLINTPRNLASLDSLLMRYGSSPDSIKTNLARQIQGSAPNSGHPMGYFMASVILKQLGKDSLLQDIGNPFAFVYRYNRVALKSKDRLPVFSNLALQTISDLEEKYAK